MVPPWNLFQEVVQDKWDLIVVSPEMMQEAAFTHCILDKRVVSSIGWVFIDEPHLAIDWSFRNAYTEIRQLRSRIGDSGIAWAAYTATIAPGSPLRKLKNVLGFTDGHYKLIRMPVDRPEIKYVPEFFGHPHTGMEIPDIGWLIPSKAKDAADIPQCLVRCESIKNIVRVAKYLSSLVGPTIPNKLTGGLRIIMPFHSQLTEETRTASLEAFRSGEVRVLVMSDCGMVGLDLDAHTIVIFDVPRTFSGLIQWVGRVGRRGPATAFIYAPDWMRIEGEDELQGKGGAKPMAPTTLKNRQDQRAKYEDVVIRFFNASWIMCPRRINAMHWGDIGPQDTFTPPPRCCNQHERDNSRLAETALRAAQMTKKSVKQVLPKSQGDYLPLDSEQQRQLFTTFVRWRKMRWSEIGQENLLLTDVFFIPDRLLSRLCEKLHLLLDFKRFEMIMAEWDALEAEGRSLYDLAKAELMKFEEANRAKKAEEELVKSKKKGKGRTKAKAKATDCDGFSETGSTHMPASIEPSGLATDRRKVLQPTTNHSQIGNKSNDPLRNTVHSEKGNAKRPRTWSQSLSSEDENIPTQAREPHLSSRGRLVKPRVREY